MPFFPSMPEDATTKHVFTAHPEIYSHWVRVSEAILRDPSPLTPAQRELIGAYVSSLNACQYCYGGHRAAAELFGIAPQTIDGLIQDLATAPIDSKLRPILAFVKKLTLTSTRMTQADADAVFAAGWDEAALHSAIAVCCLFNFMNRLVDGHGIEADRASFAAWTQACRNGIRRPIRGGDGKRHAVINRESRDDRDCICSGCSRRRNFGAIGCRRDGRHSWNSAR
jgi:uncharacterized peroxidase-related enzyme